MPKPIFLKFRKGLPITRAWAIYNDDKYIEGHVEDCTKIECIEDELPSFENWSPFDG